MVCRESDLSRIQLINGNGTSLYIAQNFCLLTSCVPTRFHQFHILFGLFSFAPKESLFCICGDRGYMSNLCTFCLILLWTWNCSKNSVFKKRNLFLENGNMILKTNVFPFHLCGTHHLAAEKLLQEFGYQSGTIFWNIVDLVGKG